MMTGRSRWIIAGASMALVLLKGLPLWSITLEAPQYPEGIGMYIWLDTITGHEPQDLQNINGLNHYIGMKEIVPETIPELTFMPWIVGSIILFGLATAAVGKRAMLFGWAAFFVLVAAVGMVDFYQWEYDYGHNLDPTAAIKVPGMNYQPPLIGSKKLLNFTAHSWPAAGGWIFCLSALTALGMAVREAGSKSRRRHPRSGKDGGALKETLQMLVPVLLLAGCMPQPKPLVHGLDQCAFCRMVLSDERYGGEIVTVTGKVLTFDSIECMAAHERSGHIPEADIHSRWVVDFADPPTLIPVQDAFFLHSRDLPSPMRMNLTAFGVGITREAVLHAFYGEVLLWHGVDSLVQHKRAGDSTGFWRTLARP